MIGIFCSYWFADSLNKFVNIRSYRPFNHVTFLALFCFLSLCGSYEYLFIKSLGNSKYKKYSIFAFIVALFCLLIYQSFIIFSYINELFLKLLYTNNFYSVLSNNEIQWMIIDWVIFYVFPWLLLFSYSFRIRIYLGREGLT